MTTFIDNFQTETYDGVSVEMIANSDTQQATMFIPPLRGLRYRLSFTFDSERMFMIYNEIFILTHKELFDRLTRWEKYYQS